MIGGRIRALGKPITICSFHRQTRNIYFNRLTPKFPNKRKSCGIVDVLQFQSVPSKTIIAIPFNQYGKYMHPVTLSEFCSAVNRIKALHTWQPPIAVAVSGGPDSLALLHLLTECIRLKEKGKSGSNDLRQQIHALTVDHGLRPESADEADRVANFAKTRGISHCTLRVPWSTSGFPKFPHPHRTEAPARFARLRLLRNYMKTRGIETLWVGHHRGDQVENRLTWGYGMRAVGVMPIMVGQDLIVDDHDIDRFLVRPLLQFDKARLLATCEANSLPYSIDLTNLIPEHAPRNKLRQTLAGVHHRYLALADSSLQSSKLQLKPDFGSSAKAQVERWNTTVGERGPLALLHRVIKDDDMRPPFTAFFSRSRLLPSNAVQLHEPKPGTITLRPNLVPLSLSPSCMRDLLRGLITFVSPTGSTISQIGVENARATLFEPHSGHGKQSVGIRAFTPGANVVFTPQFNFKENYVEWIIHRQKFRRHENKQTSLQFDRPLFWDNRIWLSITRSSFEPADFAITSCPFLVDASEKWVLPRIWRSNEKTGMVELWFDLATQWCSKDALLGETAEAAHQTQHVLKGSYEADGYKLEWTIRP